MTCIATDGKTMAGDGLSASGSMVISRSMVKVFHLEDGRVIGVTGNRSDYQPLIDFLNDPASDAPSFLVTEDPPIGLVIDPDGNAWRVEGASQPYRVDLPATLGSGEEVALGAMLRGATPREAVAVASSCITTVGGLITELSPRKARHAHR